ncbi:uncharacterized protein LOC130744550 [Lotus japonicus]|uniref:uncharacterized protein LOC130744550 n=1 Tax=Lotus japonicus TaxID=34305 RepID=UPI002590B85F|nr:uncharacterized protein LOC130744550 [Lotus japonicus]
MASPPRGSPPEGRGSTRGEDAGTAFWEREDFWRRHWEVILPKDQVTRNWWLRAENTYIGYFPAELFSGYFLYADQGGWTGKTISGDLPSPPMGSGHLPDGNYRHSAYISRMAFRNLERQDVVPLTGMLALDADSPQCYNVTWEKYVDDNLQHVIEFGGPCGNCGP